MSNMMTTANSVTDRNTVPKRVNPKSSQHKVKSFFFFCFFPSICVKKMDVNRTYGNRFRIYVKQNIMLSALNLSSDVWQLLLNKAGKKSYPLNYSVPLL